MLSRIPIIGKARSQLNEKMKQTDYLISELARFLMPEDSLNPVSSNIFFSGAVEKHLEECESLLSSVNANKINGRVFKRKSAALQESMQRLKEVYLGVLRAHTKMEAIQ